jgi:hypothetical protein
MRRLRAAVVAFAFVLAVALAIAPAAAFNLPFRVQGVTGAAGSSTLNNDSAIITTEALTTAAGATYTETFNSNAISATSLVFVSVGNGSNSAGVPMLATVTPGAAKATIVIVNNATSAAFNGTLVITVLVFN